MNSCWVISGGGGGGGAESRGTPRGLFLFVSLMLFFWHLHTSPETTFSFTSAIFLLGRGESCGAFKDFDALMCRWRPAQPSAELAAGFSSSEFIRGHGTKTPPNSPMLDLLCVPKPSVFPGNPTELRHERRDFGNAETWIYQHNSPGGGVLLVVLTGLVVPAQRREPSSERLHHF